MSTFTHLIIECMEILQIHNNLIISLFVWTCDEYGGHDVWLETNLCKGYNAHALLFFAHLYCVTFSLIANVHKLILLCFHHFILLNSIWLAKMTSLTPLHRHPPPPALHASNLSISPLWSFPCKSTEATDVHSLQLSFSFLFFAVICPYLRLWVLFPQMIPITLGPVLSVICLESWRYITTPDCSPWHRVSHAPDLGILCLPLTDTAQSMAALPSSISPRNN